MAQATHSGLALGVGGQAVDEIVGQQRPSAAVLVVDGGAVPLRAGQQVRHLRSRVVARVLADEAQLV